MTNTDLLTGPAHPSRELQLDEQRQQLDQARGYKGYGYGMPPEDEDVIDLREYWNVLVRRRGTIFTVLGIAIVTALIATFLTTPIYRGSLLLQIERESGKVLEYESLTPEESVNTKDFYETQYELLQSRTLARRVIDQLGLQSSKSFRAMEEPSLLGRLASRLKGMLSGEANDEEKEPDYEGFFLENLHISPVKNSRLVRVEYDSPDPEEAAAAANALAENFVNTTLERRYDASSYAQSFLQERIQQARANLEDSERRLIAYAKEREIINLDDKLEILMQSLKETNTALVSAESERIAAEADFKQMMDQGSVRTAGGLESPVIQQYKARRAALEAEYQEKLRIFKPGYPKMQQIRQQIDEIDRTIAEESVSIGIAARSTYEARLRQEGELNARINEIKGEILALQDRSTDYQTLKREVDTNSELYDGLLQRMKEIGVVAGIGTNNISIVDQAEVPREKYKPSLAKNLAIAIALGLFGGALIAFLLETLDDTVKTSEDVEKRIGAPVLTMVPYSEPLPSASVDQGIGLLAFQDPKSALAESYRSLRTSLIFSTSEGAPKLLSFTSSAPGEGKTTSATSTAITFAQAGGKVLLIDCDLRNPSLHQVFGLPNSEGLSNYLASSAEPAGIAKPSQVTRLFVIPSGPLPPNPVELLSSDRMTELLSVARERFDYVVLDSPPVLGLADALIIGNLARTTVFVVEAGKTRVAALEGAVKRLRSANAHILGAVLSKYGRAGSGYGYGYGYSYQYHYSYGGQGDTESLPSAAT